MVILKCPHCPYETTIKCNYKRHLNRKISCINVPKNVQNVPIDVQNVPKNVQNVPIDVQNVPIDVQNVPNKCDKCSKIFKTAITLRRHIGRCNGIHSLQCGICGLMFDNRKNKYYHVKKGKCKPPPSPGDHPTTSSINSSVTNNTNTHSSYNTNSFNTNNVIVLNAFGKEDLSQIANDKEFLNSVLKNKESGIVQCIRRIYCNEPENRTIKKTNKKDDFVDIFDGKEWQLQLKDKAYETMIKKAEGLSTDRIDEIIENGEYNKHKRMIRTFHNQVGAPLDFEYNNLDTVRDDGLKNDVDDIEARRMNKRMQAFVYEMLYREHLNSLCLDKDIYS